MEYTDLTILDCNRQHSVQALSGNDENPALFTNELGEGIQLNVGDKVSIQGAYISEIGAGADTVEFKGESLGKTRTINFIRELQEYPTDIDDLNPDDPTERAVPLINGFQRIKSIRDTFTYELKDNETYISQQYYLNTNGESGYVFLPRRFIYPDPTGSDPIPNVWTSTDQYIVGRTNEQIPNQFVSSDYMFIYGGDADQDYNIDTGFYRLRSDNSRLTLMRRIDTGILYTLLRDKTIRKGAPPLSGYYPTSTEPCEEEYEIYTDYFKVSIDSGFTSPENLGEEITKQLKNPDKGTKFKIKDNQGNPRDISVSYTSNTFKPFLCASIDTFSKKHLTAYNARDNLQLALNYISNYYNIYCKRPEIRVAGQKCNTSLGVAVGIQVLPADRTTSTITTTYEWTDPNLENLRDLFKAQKLYPELFDNDNFHNIQPSTLTFVPSVKNTRFLHINRTLRIGEKLGGDNMNTTDDGSGQPAQATKQSVPIFFYFDSTKEDTYTEGQDTDNLCYGFASKYYVGTTGYIQLHPELIGGINIGAFGDDGATRIHSGQSIGFDWSFNSYGSVMACGTNGRSDYDYLGVNEWGILNASKSASGIEPINPVSGLLRYNYIGANNPLFKYDPDQQRFYFSQLHTPELAGQAEVGAGDNLTDNEKQDNTREGGAIVYKVNKRVNRYTFTPDMKPYDTVSKITYKKTDEISAGVRDIVVKNRNIQSWAIFDSVCGVYFTDLGYDKEDFSRSMWGILGFTYNQLFSEATSSNNRISRVSNLNLDSLNLLTTNGTVAPSDLRNYIVNQYGAVFFTTQIPTTSVLTSTAHTTSPQYIESTPAITQGTSSENILAQNLPRKMLRPYYTIRSDIIDNNPYVGGKDSKTTLPVCGLCDKQYSGADYFFGSDNEFTFTITKKKVITSITTAITDPNQSFARVDNDSAVIYKIMKNRRDEEDLITNYLKKLESKK